MTKKILIAVDAPGPAAFIAPVIPLLKEERGKGKVVSELRIITVKESPTKVLKKYQPLQCDSKREAEKIYRNFNPDILLTAPSLLELGPFVIGHLNKLARQNQKRIIGFQDFWANHRWKINFKWLKAWEAILVIDQLAKKLILEDGFRGKTIVTGSPAFDKFRSVKVFRERKRLRELFKIPDKTAVLIYSGTGTPQSHKEDEITFKFLAQAVRELKKRREIILIVRHHPRDENPKRYLKISPDLEELDTSSIESTDELLPMADAVLGMYATNLVHACYLKIPGISILLPRGGKRRLKKIRLDDFPPNKVGATVGIYKESVPLLKNVIEKILDQPVFRAKLRQAQAKRFLLPRTPAAFRVAQVIRALIELS